MANPSKKSCQVCGTNLSGRKDAKTCSSTCRKRLQRARRLLLEEAHSLKQSAVQAEASLKSLETAVIPVYATEGGFIGDAVPVNIIKPQNSPEPYRPPEPYKDPLIIGNPDKSELDGEPPLIPDSPLENPNRPIHRWQRLAHLGPASLVVLALLMIGASLLISSRPASRQTASGGQQLSQSALDKALSTDYKNKALDINFDTTLTNGKKLTATGQVLFSNLTDSDQAFRLQDAAGNVLLNVNTLNDTVSINGLRGSGAGLTGLNGSNITIGTVSADRLPADLTAQGNSFNGPGQLVQLNSAGILPALDGSLLTAVNASNISSGTLSENRLSPNVALKNADNQFTGSNTFNGSALNQSTVNSTTFFQIQDSTGGSNLFVADTTNSRIGIGKAPTLGLLDVNGNIFQNGNQVCDSSNNCGYGAGSGDLSHLGNAFGVPIKVGTTDNNGLSIIANNNTVATFTNTGAALFENSANSTTAFQIQNAAGTSNLFVADTADSKIAIGMTPLAAGAGLQVNTTGGIGLANNGFFDVSAGFIGAGTSVYSYGAICAGNDDVSCNSANGVVIQGSGSNVYGNTYLTGSGTSYFNAGNVAIGATSSPGQKLYVAGDTIIKNSSTRAFQIQNAAGTSNLFVADTTNSKIGIGTAPNGSGAALQVVGSIDLTGPLSLSGGDNQTIQDYADNLTFTVDVDNNGNGNLYTFNGNGSANAVLKINNSGASIFRNLSDSVAGFQVQDSLGNEVLTVDTTNRQAILGRKGGQTGKLLFYASTNNNSVQLVGPSTPSANQVITLPDETGTVCTTAAGGVCNTAGGLSNVAYLNGTGPQTFTGNNKFTGTVLSQNSSNSTAAFQIQNAIGGNLFQIDTSNSNITLNGNNSGELQAWATNANALPAIRRDSSSVVANGYIYDIGGAGGQFSPVQPTVYYAKLNTDGSTGSWTTNTNALPTARAQSVAITANGFVYIIGGEDTSLTAQSSVFYAKLNADGSVGTWNTASNSLPVILQQASGMAANGYVYVIGGLSGGSGQNKVYYAKLNADGSVGTWTTNAINLPAGRPSASVADANGYVYVIGGQVAGVAQNTVYYAKLNSDGSTGSWTTNVNVLPSARQSHSSVVANGYLYVVGGVDATGTIQSTVYYARLNSDGSTGTWITAANSLPNGRTTAATDITNGYVYELGGYDGTAADSTVYYASTPRIQLGGSLDLVGLGGQTLANPGDFSQGSTGGSLTAGNTNIVGSLQVAGQANFSQGAAVLGNFTDGGNALFQNAANSTIAFQIQNASGTQLLNADTVNSNIYVGSNGSPYAMLLTGASGAYGSTPDSAATSITGDLDIRVRVAPNSWTPAALQRLLAKWTTSGNQRSYALDIQTSGKLLFEYSPDGTTSVSGTGSSVLPFTNGQAGWVRATYAAATGVVNYYYANDSSTIPTSWTAAGSNSITSGAIFDSTAVVEVGSSGAGSSFLLAGNVYRSLVYNGIGGSLVADFDPLRAASTAATTFTASTGETWTRNGSATFLANSSATLGINESDFNTNIATFRNASNSTNAFQVQNASGSNLVQVDTANSNITLNGNKSGELQTWQTNSNSLPLGRNDAGTVIANGYIYEIGGGGSGSNTVYYGKLNTDGSVGAFSTGSNNLTNNRKFAASVTANGYFYVIGGSSDGTAANAQSTVYYTKLNADGSTGTWTTNANNLPNAVFEESAAVANGYVYVLGGQNTSAVNQTAVYYAKLNADGSTGSWTTSGNSLPTARNGVTTVVANGYIYAIGGTAGGTNIVYYASLNSDGSTSSFSTNSNNLPASIGFAGSVVVNGYVYVIGGENGGGVQSNIYYGRLNSDGSVSAFATSITTLPAIRAEFRAVTANGYIYVVGGGNGLTPQTSVYYASTERVQIGGSLDLVGLSGQNLTSPGESSTGSTGGSLTAGNTNIVGSLQVAGQANFSQGAAVLGNFTNSGNALFQNATNSTVAFQIQNAAGSNLVQVDSLNSNITLNGSNSGELQAWATNGNALTNVRRQATSIVANGYVYVLGGFNGSTSQTSVYYAKINTDGSTGTWTTSSNPLPLARRLATSVVANGYVYEIGGFDDTNAVSTVYYAKLNADGSTGTWQTNTNALPAIRRQATSIVANGYVYVFGGSDGTTIQSTVYYAKLNADGSTGAWTTSSNPLIAARSNHSSVVANGYVYIIGGVNSGSAPQSTVYYAKLNSDGSTSTWTTNANPLTVAEYNATSAVANGYVYEIGGDDGSPTRLSTVYYAKLNTDGSTGTWISEANALPGPREQPTTVASNGYIYEIGGFDGSADNSTVYYASTPRVKIGGSIDLVGLGGQTLANPGDFSQGSTGGSLTAGNGMFVGSLQVAGQANFSQGAAVLGNFTNSGNALFQNSANSTVAFQIQNASGTQLLNADTVNSAIRLGNNSAPYALSLPGVDGSYANTPDSAATSVTGDLDIMVRVAANDWAPNSVPLALIAKEGTAGQRGYRLDVDTNGKLRFVWSNDGTTLLSDSSTVAPSVSDGQSLWVRATLKANNGAGGNDVKFYTAADQSAVPTSWTQLGSTVTTAGTTSIFDNTSALEVGSRQGGAFTTAGIYYRALVYNGIGGTLAADFDPLRAASTAATTFTASTGETWTRNGTAIFLANSSATFGTSESDFNSNTAIFRNGANSNTAFQIQSANGNQILTTDTSNGTVGIGISGALSNAKLYVRSSLSGAVIRADSYAANNLLELQNSGTNVATVSNTGAAVFQNSANSTTAFQVQRASGATLFNIDTSTTANLVTNGDFEGAGQSGWGLKGSDAVGVVTTQQWQGNSSLQVTTSVAANDGAQYTGYIFGATTQYTMSLYAKVSGGSITDINIGRQDQSGTDIDCLTGQTLTTSWTRFSCTFTTGATISSPNLYIKKTGVSAETFFIDGVQLQTGASVTPFGADGALQLNGLVNSPIAFQNKSDSTNAFQVQNAAGTSTILAVDTTNKRVGIGNNAPDATLNVGNSGALLDDAGGTNITSRAQVVASNNNLKLNGFGYQANVTSAVSGGNIFLTTTDNRIIINSTGGDISSGGTITSLSAAVAKEGSFNIGSGIDVRSINTSLTINGGNIYSYKAINITDGSGSGTVTNQYGLYVNNLTKGSTSIYPIYVAGSTNPLFTVTGTGQTNFRNSSDSTAAFQIQNNSGAALLIADSSGMKITINGDLALNGHIITGNKSGSTTAAAGATAGTGASVTITGNDTSGKIVLTTGTGAAAGDLADITLANTFGSVPNVVLTAGDGNAAKLQQYVNPTTTAFSVNAPAGGAGLADGTSYTFYYHVMQ